jgi:hypothetical protein
VNIDLFPAYRKEPISDESLLEIAHELLVPDKESIHRMAAELIRRRKEDKQ